jgi:hypothetical protein
MTFDLKLAMERDGGRCRTHGEERFLAKRVCFLCETPLHRNSCGSIYSAPCSEELMAKRRADCLKTYKPRKPTKVEPV